MKLNKPLNKIFNNETKVKILRFLTKTQAEWNGRQIAKEMSVTPATAHKALLDLYEEGLLILRNVGKTYIYSLKQDNYIVANLIKPRFTSEEKIFDNLIRLIKKIIIA